MNRIQTQEFIQQKFTHYYKQNLNDIQPPTSIEKREFAFLLFKEKTMLRHKGFKHAQDLRESLLNITPSDVYYSSAYYEKPEEDMDAKGWTGADVVFDIDADHIPTPCNKQHDTWTCKNCNTTGHGPKPEKCPKCEAQKITTVSWPCDTCLGTAKEETIKLIDALERDFGISTKEMTAAFSGHRGYHIHIEDETIRTLDAMARKEIVDFVMGIGLDPALYSTEKGEGPKLDDYGWKGRIARGTYELLLTATQEQLEKADMDRKAAAQVIRQREKILESWNAKGPWKILKGIGPGTWQKIIRRAIERQSVKIDTVVTTDIHRLIRMTDTLHGETGLLKVEVPVTEIEAFDPFKKAVAFESDDAMSVHVSDAPKFRLGDKFFGPFRNQRIELPASAAMFLLCKGAAEIMEEATLVQ